MAFSMAAALTLNPSSGCVSYDTGVPLHTSQFRKAHPVRRGDDDLVALLPTSTLITLKMECFPPTLTTHSLGS